MVPRPPSPLPPPPFLHAQHGAVFGCSCTVFGRNSAVFGRSTVPFLDAARCRFWTLHGAIFGRSTDVARDGSGRAAHRIHHGTRAQTRGGNSPPPLFPAKI
eukprot:1337866-Rhodomonas_salina.1